MQRKQAQPLCTDRKSHFVPPHGSYYDGSIFDPEIRCRRDLVHNVHSWICNTFGALHQKDMVETFRNNPTAFRRVVNHNGTAVSLGYLKAL